LSINGIFETSAGQLATVIHVTIQRHVVGCVGLREQLMVHKDIERLMVTIDLD
jgi:hypothetical protein